MFKDLVRKTRSYRRFDNTVQITEEMLKDIIDTARLTPSAANRQPIKYLVSNKKEINDKIFPCLGWAAYLTEWAGPTRKEQPSAYIILYSDMQFTPHLNVDPGIVAQTILLAATEKGLGGCMIASFDKKKLKRAVHLGLEYEFILVIALGKPTEEIVLEDVGEDGSIMYWRDENDVHHVPKRKLEEMVSFLGEHSST